MKTCLYAIAFSLLLIATGAQASEKKLTLTCTEDLLASDGPKTVLVVKGVNATYYQATVTTTSNVFGQVSEKTLDLGDNFECTIRASAAESFPVQYFFNSASCTRLMGVGVSRELKIAFGNEGEHVAALTYKTPFGDREVKIGTYGLSCSLTWE